MRISGKGGCVIASAPQGEIVAEEPITGPLGEGTPKGAKKQKDKESILLRRIKTECLNYRSPASDKEGVFQSPIFLNLSVRATNASSQCAIMGYTKIRAEIVTIF